MSGQPTICWVVLGLVLGLVLGCVALVAATLSSAALLRLGGFLGGFLRGFWGGILVLVAAGAAGLVAVILIHVTSKYPATQRAATPRWEPGAVNMHSLGA
jgi:uncharacterized membrane protein